MTTRAIVGIVTEPFADPTLNQRVGLYLHFDGYPSEVLPTLATIIERDTPEAARNLIVSDLARYGGWRDLDATQTHQHGESGYIEGYGEAYTDEVFKDLTEVQNARELMDAEYGYFIAADGSIEFYDLYELDIDFNAPLVWRAGDPIPEEH